MSEPHVPEYNAITPSLIPKEGCAVIEITPDGGTTTENQTSCVVALKPPCCGAEPPAQANGVGAPKDAVAPTVVKFKNEHSAVTGGSAIALHGSSFTGAALAGPSTHI